MSKSMGTLFRNSKVLINSKVGKNGNMGLCYKGILFSNTIVEKKVKSKGDKNGEQ